MDFGPFILFSLFYAVVGVRVVRQLVARRRETFDRVFTAADRALVDQAAFFVLIPISVALHELGHAVTIRALGGTIEDGATTALPASSASPPPNSPRRNGS